MNKRVLVRHVLFWLTFYSMSLFNELYLSTSFALHPSWLELKKCAGSLGILYLVKIAVVYTFLLVILPGWFSSRRRILYFTGGLVLLLAGALLMRVLTQQVIWVFIFNERPPEFTYTQLLARYFYSLMDLLQISAFALALRLLRMRITAARREKQLVQEKLNAEIQLLKSQTNPHFLFNSLNTIYSLSRNRSELTPDAVERLSHILRYMLYEASLPLQPLHNELDVVKDYVALQRLRFGKRIRFVLYEEIDQYPVLIAPLLLLPLVENAYKHSNQEDAAICCRLSLKRSHLRLYISNPVAQLSMPGAETEGIGMGNIRRQLELLYHKFQFDFREEKQIFEVNLEIDLNSYAGNELFDNRG
jgi:two-component system LytT family sensor kinase